MTKVSIITPYYNSGADSYQKSLDSIARQSDGNFEWVIVDDGSDNPIIESGGVPIASIRTEGNYGPSVARNLGFQIASGEIITYLDMGDELFPDRVENLIKLYDNHDIEISFCGYDIVQGNIVDHFHPFNFIGVTMSAYDYILLLKNQNITIPMGVAHRRKPFVLAGGFQRGIVCGEDGVLWRRMVDHTDPRKIMFTDDKAGIYYVSQTGQSRTQRRFEMGGFAINGELMDNGRYLDNDWYRTYTSEGYYE